MERDVPNSHSSLQNKKQKRREATTDLHWNSEFKEESKSQFSPTSLTSKDIENALNEWRIYEGVNPWRKCPPKMQEAGFESLADAMISMECFRKYQLYGYGNSLREMKGFGIREEDVSAVLGQLCRVSHNHLEWSTKEEAIFNEWRQLFGGPRKKRGNSNLEKGMWACLQNNKWLAASLYIPYTFMSSLHTFVLFAYSRWVSRL